MSRPALPPCICGSTDYERVINYEAAPKGEIGFSFSAGQEYRREVWRCRGCGHFISRHQMDLAGFYEADYVSSTYGDAAGIRRAFERIMALPPEKSDNWGRVRRVVKFAAGHLGNPGAAGHPTILDVGSGLGVFLARMKAHGWDGTALDADPRLLAHAREVVGVKTVCGDFMTITGLGRFDMISFNKVLEHLEDPRAMLAKSAVHLREGGLVYVEVPDGEEAIREGGEREEFFIEHYHIFSMASLALLAAQAGFRVQLLERLREPSSKYTLRAFLDIAA